MVVAAVRPARPAGHGHAWEDLTPWAEQITAWVTVDLQLTNIRAGSPVHTFRRPLVPPPPARYGPPQHRTDGMRRTR